MQILSCFFHENQKRWFGKRGTSLLGFMVTTNATDPIAKEKGQKDIMFAMMVTDDVVQDKHEVACAKAVVYKRYFPEHVAKIRFFFDGAGCFKSQLNRALQPLWKVWVKKTEVSYRIMPAGDGKSCLDGMFGRLNTVLASAVNASASYYNAGTVCEAVKESNGLSLTHCVLFEPDRSVQLFATLSMSIESVLMTELVTGTNKSLAFHHSRVGSGIEIDPRRDIKFGIIRAKDGKKKKKNEAEPLVGIYRSDVSMFCNCFSVFETLLIVNTSF
jgi:hypothetical protein